MDTPLATLEHGDCKADIYENPLPGSFTIRYLKADGTLIAEEPLTGVSTFRQREDEILTRLRDLCEGKDPNAPSLADSGEYSG